MRAAGQKLESSLKTAEAACLDECLDTNPTSHRSSASRVQNGISSILGCVNLLPMAEATKEAVIFFVWSFVDLFHYEGAGIRLSPLSPVFTIFGVPADVSTAVPFFLICIVGLVIP